MIELYYMMIGSYLKVATMVKTNIKTAIKTSIRKKL